MGIPSEWSAHRRVDVDSARLSSGGGTEERQGAAGLDHPGFQPVLGPRMALGDEVILAMGGTPQP